MVDEFELIDRLQNIYRLLEEGSSGSAQYCLRALIEERVERVEQFEEEMFDNLPV